MAALPYMQLYVADYLADTAHLNATEHGAYLMLLMNYWQRGKPLPDDDERLAMIARTSVEQWLSVRSTIVEFFVNENGFWTHKRVEADLAKVRRKSEAAATAGKASGQKRQETSTTSNGRSTDVQRTLNHTDTDTDTDTEEKNTGADAPCAVPRETIPSKPKRTPRDALCEILDDDHAGAVLDHRRALRKPLTVRAAELLAKQLALARDGPNAAADRMIARGWQSYKPEWDTENDARTRNNGKPQFSGVVANLRDMLLQPENGDRGGSEPLSDHEPEPRGRRFGVA